MKQDYYNLPKELKEFLKTYSVTPETVSFNTDAGYPIEDAMFDQVLFSDFCKHLRKTEKFNLWISLNDGMDKDVESREYRQATKIWNKICNLTTKKVKHLLGGK